MGKFCEFCTASRATVYCKADGAYLCLSCDGKVHSANALSGRHLRYRLCDSCKHDPAHVWCVDHRTFMCSRCDGNLHNSVSKHQKRALSGYMGCPSAKDFAALWGLDLNETERSLPQEHIVSCSDGSMFSRGLSGENAAISRGNFQSMVSRAESKSGQGSQKRETHQRYRQKHKNFIVPLQLLDLKKLQLKEGNNPSPVLHGKERINVNLSENLDQNLLLKDGEASLQQNVNQTKDVEAELLSFPQLEHSPSSSAVGMSLQSESFWQCKCPDESIQMWSNNMEDIGFCEEPVFEDNFDIPDMDLTFRNFEETFESEENPTKRQSDYNHVSCSSFERNLCIDKPDNNSTTAIENTSVASSAYTSSSGAKDDMAGEVSCHSYGAEVAQPDDAEDAVAGHKVKKARLHQKQLQYRTRKARPEVRKQKKDQLMKKDGYKSESVDVSRSF